MPTLILVVLAVQRVSYLRMMRFSCLDWDKDRRHLASQFCRWPTEYSNKPQACHTEQRVLSLGHGSTYQTVAYSFSVRSAVIIGFSKTQPTTAPIYPTQYGCSENRTTGSGVSLKRDTNA